MSIHINTADLGNNLFKLGTGLLSTGMMYESSREMMRGSIFGGCYPGFGGGLGFGGFGMPGAYPGIFGMGMGMGNMGMGMGMPMAGIGMGMPFGIPGMGTMFPSYTPAAPAPAAAEQPFNARRAHKVNKDVDTTDGATFEAATQRMLDDKGNPVADEYIQIMDDEWMDLADKTNRTDDEEAALNARYKENLNGLAQSYLMYIDKENGNGNGELTIGEFTSNELKNTSEDNRSEKIEIAHNAFKTLDLNNDGVIDWREMGAYINTVDIGTDKTKFDYGKQDGIIRANDFARYSETIASGNSKSLKEKIIDTYRRLFGA